MKFKGCLALLLSGVISNASALDFGLGVSVNDDDNSIYAPIKITESLITEPYYRKMKAHYTYGQDETDKVVTEEVGLGVFGRINQDKDISVYYGLRTGYQEQGYKNTYGRNTSKRTLTGYRIAPTVGFEYKVLDSLSIAGEAEWFRSKVDGYNRFNNFEEKRTTITKGTDTRVIIRYYFD